MTGDVFGFHVTRVCRVRGGPETEEGLIPRAATAFRLDNSEVVTDIEQLCEGALALPSVVAAAGAMVVMGEPGAGKTSVLKEVTNTLRRIEGEWDQETDACLWVSGGDLTEHSYRDELGCHLAALPPKGDASAGSGVLTVVLDQADESPFLRHLPRQLKKSLNSRDAGRVRFLMACRTADYPRSMTPVLTEVFGASRCVDLAPLTRGEAEALADSAGVSGSELVAEAEAAGAAVLASVPLTLELLVMTYRSDGQFHGEPQDLFARGVSQLADDPDPGRLRTAVVTTAQQRLTVAGRIAAWMLLSGCRTVWRGPTFEGGAFDLPGGTLAGGTEQTAAGQYEATPQVLEETLATALFTRPDENRVVFRHSSITAFLAARYLTDRRISERQLANLFLVGAPDGETDSIPMPLRETAAWLVAMNPTGVRWLAAADPESLAVHSALVRSDDVRRLTVSRLLDRAAQIELSDTRWELARWDLFHPLLAEQLADVLETAPPEGAPDWNTTARIRLATELAQQVGTAQPRLANALLALVSNDAWHQAERRLAARAAFRCDPCLTVPVLTAVLSSLADSTYAERIDSDHELRGTLLTLLWPNHLDLVEMLAALRTPAPHIYGEYSLFLRNMPCECPEDQLPGLLDGVQKTVSRLEPSASGPSLDVSFGRIENSLVDSLIARSLGSPETEKYLPSLATIILGVLRNHHKVGIPDCLQPGGQGRESAETQSLRRLVAGSLVGAAVEGQIDPREAAWMIVHDWEYRPPLRMNAAAIPEEAVRHQLIDGMDFEWALEEVERAADSGDADLVAAFGHLASWLFQADNLETVELAHNENHPAWPYLSPYYEPIALDSVQARVLRHGHRARNEIWPEAEAFAAEQAQLLGQAKHGDNDSLCRFLRNLRFDPHTGREVERSGSILAWPGAIAFAEDLSELPALALRYLTDEHDNADSWLRQAKRDPRSWVGYVLLVELHRVGRPGLLAPESWRSWSAAILVEFVGMSTSFNEPARIELLRLAATNAPEALARRVVELVTAEIEGSRHPMVLDSIDPRWATELLVAMENLATELSMSLGITPRAANGAGANTLPDDHVLVLPDNDEARGAVLRTLRSLLEPLLAAGSIVAASIVNGALEARPETTGSSSAAVMAAEILLTVGPEVNWPRVKASFADNEELSRQLCEACGQSPTAQRIQGSVSEAALADLYLWLSQLYDPGGDASPLGVHWVSPEEQARRWRDNLLRELSRRATGEAVHQLSQLTTRFPDRLSVAAALVAASKQFAAASWQQLEVDNVIRVLQDPTRRVIRTSTDLLDAVLEVLQEIGRGLPSHSELLWDRTPGKRTRRKSAQPPDRPNAEDVPDAWRPKPEAALCAYLVHELTLRLAGHRVAVNREVLVHPTDPYGAGDRTDILIDAISSPSSGFDTALGTPVKLVVEVKGAWNPEVMTAQADQLAGRYLPQTGTDVGIYLVGWYPIELWNAPGDNRRTQAKKLAPDTLLADLQDQAAQHLREDLVHVRPLVMSIPRPHKQ